LHSALELHAAEHWPPVHAVSAGQSEAVVHPHAPWTHWAPWDDDVQSVHDAPHAVGLSSGVHEPPLQHVPWPHGGSLAAPHALEHVPPAEHVGVWPPHATHAPVLPHAAEELPGWHVVPSQQPPWHARPPAHDEVHTPPAHA
jgi:hypothetical protein